MNDIQMWKGQRLIGNCLGLFQPEDGNPHITTEDGQQFLLPFELFGAFVEAHGDTPDAGHNATSIFAEFLNKHSASSSGSQLSAVWVALSSGRVLDLGIGGALLRMAEPVIRSIPAVDDCTTLAKLGQETFNHLYTLDADRRSKVPIPTFGPLGLGLNVAASTALEVTRLRGLTVQADARKRLVAACSTRAQALIKILSKKDRNLSSYFGRELRNLPDVILQPPPFLQNWVADLREQIRDARDLQLSVFLNPNDGLDGNSETWPLWAQCIPYLPQ